MKKLISIILAVMLVSALTVTSFAAPTIDYVFNADGFSYVFGSIDDVAIEDMGLKITNKNNVREYAEFSAIDPYEIDKVNNIGKFGFGIKANGMLNDSFTVKPYCETADGTVEGFSYVVNPANETKETVAEGYSVATDDLKIYYRTAANYNGYNGQATDPTNTAIIPQGTSTGFKSMLVKFNIGNSIKASDIYMTFASVGDRAGKGILASGSFEIKVFAVEDALDTWAEPESDTNNYFGSIVGCAGTANELTPAMEKVFNAAPIAIATGNDLTEGNNYYKVAVDVTEYVKQQAANGKTTVTLAIDVSESFGNAGLGIESSESNLSDELKPCLAWK